MGILPKKMGQRIFSNNRFYKSSPVLQAFTSEKLLSVVLGFRNSPNTYQSLQFYRGSGNSFRYIGVAVISSMEKLKLLLK